MSLCRVCTRIATVFSWKTTYGGFQLGRSTAAGGARSVEKYDWRAPNRLLVVQTGDSASQAKVFKAHAVPQGLCEKLDQCAQTAGQTAKLPANHQKDGTGLCGRSRKGIMEGLRNIFEVDNYSALDVGYLGTRSFDVRRPKVEEGGPEVSITKRSRGTDAVNRGSGLPEIVYQCWSHYVGQVVATFG